MWGFLLCHQEKSISKTRQSLHIVKCKIILTVSDCLKRNGSTILTNLWDNCSSELCCPSVNVLVCLWLLVHKVILHGFTCRLDRRIGELTPSCMRWRKRPIGRSLWDSNQKRMHIKKSKWPSYATERGSMNCWKCSHIFCKWWMLR